MRNQVIDGVQWWFPDRPLLLHHKGAGPTGNTNFPVIAAKDFRALYGKTDWLPKQPSEHYVLPNDLGSLTINFTHSGTSISAQWLWPTYAKDAIQKGFTITTVNGVPGIRLFDGVIPPPPKNGPYMWELFRPGSHQRFNDEDLTTGTFMVSENDGNGDGDDEDEPEHRKYERSAGEVDSKLEEKAMVGRFSSALVRFGVRKGTISSEKFGRNDLLFHDDERWVLVEAKFIRRGSGAPLVRDVFGDLYGHAEMNLHLAQEPRLIALFNRPLTHEDVDFLTRHNISVVIEYEGNFCLVNDVTGHERIQYLIREQFRKESQ